MSTIISMANPSGGMGRTTTAFNIAAEPAMLGSSARVIDVDFRWKVARDLGLESMPRPSLLADEPLTESAAATPPMNLDALAGSQNFADALSASSRLSASTLDSLILSDMQINERRPATG